MANLLRWSVGMSLPKKKDENNTPLISSLQMMGPTPIKANTVNNTTNNTNTNTTGNVFSRIQQINDQIRQQAEQRRQQEEQQRQQQIERARREQEERQRKENERRLQQQQALQQKQNNLLNSSLNGGSLLNNLSQNTNFTTFRNNLQTNQQKTNRWVEEMKQKAEQETAENPWKKYYDEERQKVRDQAYKNDHFGSWLQDVFNSGWDRRLAETAARNRYASELNQKAYDDNGNVKDSNAANLAKQVSGENLKVANEYAETEHANSRALGASYDSDYKDNPFAATANAIRRMDVGNAIFEGDDSGATGAGRFLFNLLPGMLNAPTTGATNISEAISGKGLDSSTGRKRDLDTAERWGRGLSGAVDAAGVFFGGSKDLLDSVGKAIFKEGASAAAKQAVKSTSTSVIKGYIKAMLEEGAEEGVQQAFEFFGDGGKLITEDGQFDADSFKQLLAESGQAAALGAVGGGIFHAGSRVVDAAKSKLSNNKSSDVGSNFNNRLINNNDTNVSQNEDVLSASRIYERENNTAPENVQTNQDGSMVKVNEDGSTTKLSDSELANVISQETRNTGTNPFRDNAINFRSGSEDINILTRRAAQGDTYAQQRLAELTKQNQNENTDWRGKSVDEVIDQRNYDQNQETQNETNVAEEQATQNQNTTEDVDLKDFDQLTPVEQEAWLAQHSDQVMSETQLTQTLRSMGIDPTGMSRLDMLREYSSALKNTAPTVTPESEIGNTPEQSPSERAANYDQNQAKYNLQDLAEEPIIPTKTDTTGADEGSVNDSTRIPTTEELSTATPGQGRNITNEDATSLLGRVSNAVDNIYTSLINRGAVDRLSKALETTQNGQKVSKDVTFARITKEMLGEINTVRELQGKTPLTERNVTAFSNAINNHLGKHIAEYGSAKNVAKAAFDVLTGSDTLVLPGRTDSRYKGTLLAKQNADRFADTVALADTENGSTSLKSISPRSTKEIKNLSKQRDNLLGGDLVGGRTTPHTIPNESAAGLPNSARQTANTSSVSQNGENVNAKSSFAENTSGNKNFSNETRTDLKSDPLTYRPTTNEERLARANEILSTKSSDEIDNYLRENFFNVKPKDADSADMVLAGEYAKMLDAKGQFDRSTEIINRMSEIGTKQGQNIQALSLMMNRSPEGIANMAQTAIKKSGGQMTGELRQEIVQRTQEIGKTRSKRAELANENATISKQIMNGEGDLKALRKRQMQIAQEYRQSLDQEGRQFSQLSDIVGKNSPDKRSVFGSIWRAGLLSGPRTHTGNAVSNTFQNVLNAGADRFAAGLDWARAKITGTERQVVTSAGGRGKGLKRGLGAAGEVLKTGNNLWESIDNVASGSNAWGQGGELEFKNKIANTMVAKPTNFVFRAMSAGDLPFRYSAYENAIRTEAKRQGINQGLKGQALQDYINSRVATPDPELQAYGIRKGNESVYDVDTKLSDLMARVDKFIDGQDNKIVKNGLKTAKTLITPFVKVPSKVLSTAIDYSPLGSVKAIVKKLGSKNYTTGQFETDLARSGLGTAGFVGLGYALAAAGLITGGYPDDKDERNRWKAEGIEPNSIKIGDKYISLNYLGPASMLMSMGSGIQQRQEKGEDALTIVSGTLMDTLNTFLDQSYVQGLSNAVQAVTDSQRYGESYVNSFARGLVPNLLRQIAVATDPKQRQANNVGEAITSGIPGLSQTLDAKVDAYGREIENKQTLPLGQMWDALKINNSRETNDVIDEVSRLHSVDPNNKELQVTPPMEDNTLSVNGTNVKITDSQKTQLQKDVGEAAVTAMRQVMQSSQYASLSDTEKAAALDKARSNAQTQARKQFIEANGITPENNPGSAHSGGAVSDDYASKAISSAKSSGSKKNDLSINDSISQDYKDILNRYNSMSSDDWNDYLYGSTAESAAAEYKLAKAKYENNLANGDITDTQKIKKQKELAKLAVSQKWTKDYRDAYSLAGSKSDMQTFLNELDDETRAKTVATLNGLNNAMYEAGVITESTYKTRANAINNTTSKKSGSSKSKSGGMSSAEASALSSLAKTMIKGSEGNKVKTTSAPNTKRKMSKAKSSGGQSKLANYSTNLATNVTVNKGAKRSIG